MRIYKLACVCTFIILLSGCNALSSKMEEPSLKVESEIVNNKSLHNENKQEPTAILHPTKINAEIETTGQGISIFTYTGSLPVKISLSNTGTESFLYKVQNKNRDTIVTSGILNSNESFEQIYDELPEGDYIISYVVEEELDPIDIKLKLKVELLD